MPVALFAVLTLALVPIVFALFSTRPRPHVFDVTVVDLSGGEGLNPAQVANELATAKADGALVVLQRTANDERTECPVIHSKRDGDHYDPIWPYCARLDMFHQRTVVIKSGGVTDPQSAVDAVFGPPTGPGRELKRPDGSQYVQTTQRAFGPSFDVRAALLRASLLGAILVIPLMAIALLVIGFRQRGQRASPSPVLVSANQAPNQVPDLAGAAPRSRQAQVPGGHPAPPGRATASTQLTVPPQATDERARRSTSEPVGGGAGSPYTRTARPVTLLPPAEPSAAAQIPARVSLPAFTPVPLPAQIVPPMGTPVTARTHFGRDGGFVQAVDLLLWAELDRAEDGPVAPGQRLTVVGLAEHRDHLIVSPAGPVGPATYAQH